jgi:CubicO group peptidase (beta-lactamase class C family)
MHRLTMSVYLGIFFLLFTITGQIAAQTSLSDEDAAGYKALTVNAAVFVAHRAPEDVLRDELAGSDPRIATLDDTTIDHANRAVSVQYAGSDVPRLAIHHPQLSTVLLPPGATLKDVASLPKITMPFQTGKPEEIEWPNGDVIPENNWPVEVNRARLDDAIELAFTGEKYKPHKTIGVAIVFNGRLIAERYAPSWGPHTQYRSWSSAKSITNALVGILVGEGKLDVKKPAPISAWQKEGDPRRKITLENLLHMSSGLKSTGSSTPVTYWGGANSANEIVKAPLEVEPRTRWKYANYDTLLAVLSMKEVIGDQDQYVTFPRRALLNKIGMRDTYPQMDPYGNYILSSQVYTTPRDLARLGLLYLNDGVWKGERILPEGWVDYTATPAPAKKSGEGWGYGAQFWLFNEDPRVPNDAFTTAGHRGQHVTVVPSRHLVVARMGLDPLVDDSWDQIEFTKDILKTIVPPW